MTAKVNFYLYLNAFLRKCCPSFNLGDLFSSLKLLVREQSVVFAFNVGAQNARVG